jgi:hypothetical protein
VLCKARFWEIHAHKPFNDRQRLMPNCSTVSKGNSPHRNGPSPPNCSQDTALRDILDFVNHGALAKDPAGGHSRTGRDTGNRSKLD